MGWGSIGYVDKRLPSEIAEMVRNQLGAPFDFEEAKK